MSDVRRILVAQGGGPTAVINQSLAGIALEARKFAGIEAVYGAFHGVRGIVNQDFVDLGQETADDLNKVAQTPAAALGSTRDKPDLQILPGNIPQPPGARHRLLLLYRRQ